MKRFTTKTVLMVLVLWLAALSQAVHADPIAPVIEPDGVSFTKLEAVSWLLVDGPQGFRWEQSFAAGEVARFHPERVSPTGLLDGRYAFSLLGGKEQGDKGEVALLSSGWITIENGQVAGVVLGGSGLPAPDAVDAPADVVHNDDVIILSDLCVGSGCANGEDFGSDSMRFAQNVIRIHFEDDSTGGSFPKNDWRIVINETTGSQEFFGIEDATALAMPFRIDAGAGANALYIDSTGEVGLGTSAPQSALHIVKPNEPTIELEQKGGLSGDYRWRISADESLFSIQDLSGGAKRSLQIKAGAPTGSLVLASNGDVGVGTTAPNAPLHVVRSNGASRLHVEEASQIASERTLGLFTNRGALNLQLDNTDVNRQWLIGVRSGGQFRIQSNQAAPGVLNFLMDLDGNATLSGNLTVGSCSGCTAARGADDRVVSADVLTRLSELPIRRWRTRGAVEHLLPDMDAFHRLTGLGHADGIAPLDVATLSLAAAQNQEKRIQSLEAENRGLRSEVAALTARLTALEAALGVQNPAPSTDGEQIFMPSAGR